MSFITKTMLQAASNIGGGAGAGESWVSELSAATGVVGRSLDLDSTGNIYQSYNSADSGSPFMGAVKYDTDGSVIWREEYIGSSSSALCVDSNDDVIISGSTTGVPYQQAVIKLNPANGSITWQRNMLTGDFGGDRSIDVDSSNNIYAQIAEIGSFFVGESYTYKLNSSGVLQWQKGGGEDGLEFIIPAGIVVHNDGTVRELYFSDDTVISAFNTSTGNYVSNQFLSGRYRINMLVDSSDNQYIILQSLLDASDVLYILKKSASLASNTWVIRSNPVFHSAASQDQPTVAYDSVNDILYAVIRSTSVLKIFAFDGSTGTLYWQKQIARPGQTINLNSLSNKVAKYYNGHLYISASVGATTSSKAVVIKFDASGNVTDGTYGNYVVSTPTNSFSSSSLAWNTGDYPRIPDPSFATNTTAYTATSPTITETNTGL